MSIISNVSAERILATVGTGTDLSYEAAICSGNPYGGWWLPSKDPMSLARMIRPSNEQDNIDELATAKAGLAGFMGFMLYTVGVGINSASPNDSPVPEKTLESVTNARTIVYDMFKNTPNLTFIDEHGKVMPLVPWLAYQRGFGRIDDDMFSRKATFLHFGTQSKTENDPRFSGSVRVFMNPTIKDTPRAVTSIARAFFNKLGYLPSGKFMEDVTASRVQERADRVIFWAHNPDELAVIIGAAKHLHEQDQTIFENRTSLLLGTPVVTNQGELPTVRIAQDPESPNISFNSSRLVPINASLASLANEGTFSSDTARRDEFLRHLTKSGIDYGTHPTDLNFNASQDMAVIYRALAMSV